VTARHPPVATAHSEGFARRTTEDAENHGELGFGAARRMKAVSPAREVQVTGIYNQVRGETGLELNEKYADGMRTVFGIHSEGYPNLFIMGGYQASFQFNLTFMLQTQGDRIAQCIKYVREHGYTTIDAKPETEQWWVDEVIKHRGKTNRNRKCTPGYYNVEGESNRRQDGNYNSGFYRYFLHMMDVRKDIETHFRFA
jgi:hypothetical protein